MRGCPSGVAVADADAIETIYKIPFEIFGRYALYATPKNMADALVSVVADKYRLINMSLIGINDMESTFDARIISARLRVAAQTTC